MSDEKSTTAAAAAGFGSLPITRQLSVIMGVAASIALGVSVVLWSQKPSYRPLFAQLSHHDTSSVLDVLQQNGIPYQLDERSGTVLVAQGEIHQARLKLAAEGLPNGSGRGLEMLNKESSFGTSQFMETVRYRHALEGELARTIANFSNVKSSRVHLAIPKSSSFVQDDQKPSASVFVDLYSGRKLNRTEISSIVNLVASSIPGLTNDQVTLVDEKGQLLNDGASSGYMQAADKRFSYQQAVEAAYEQQVRDLLSPIMGPGKVKVQVAAEIDFTRFEQTKEAFDPDMKVVRSEQSTEEQQNTNLTNVAGGIPGSLSNQPAPAATTTQQIAGDPFGGPAPNGNRRSLVTRNFELDKTISYVRQQPGQVQRLSVAVVVDDFTEVAKSGKIKRTPLKEEELKQFEQLVKDAVGFNSVRGDRVTILNRAFAVPPPIEALPEPGLFEQSWFWDIVKQGIAGIFILIMVMTVLRPFLRGLATRPVLQPQLGRYDGGDVGGGHGQGQGHGHGHAHGSVPGSDLNPNDLQLTQEQQSYENEMHAVRQLAKQDPKRVAHVMKGWVEDE